MGVTCTASHRPHAGHQCQGSDARTQPSHSPVGRPQPGQNERPSTATAQITFDSDPIGIFSPLSMTRSCWGDRPSVVR